MSGLRTYVIMRRRGLRGERNVARRIASLTYDDVELEIGWVNSLQEVIDARGNPQNLHYVVFSGKRCVHRTRSEAKVTT